MSDRAQEHADAALRELDAICRDSLEIALPVLLNARDTAGEETPADHFIALSDEIIALLALLAEAQQKRDAALRERDYWRRNYDAQYRGSKLEAAERLAEQRGEALREALLYIPVNYKAREIIEDALADGGQQKEPA